MTGFAACITQCALRSSIPGKEMNRGILPKRFDNYKVEYRARLNWGLFAILVADRARKSVGGDLEKNV